MEENEEPFIAPLGLNVPPDVELVGVFVLHVAIHRCLHVPGSTHVRASPQSQPPYSLCDALQLFLS